MIQVSAYELAQVLVRLCASDTIEDAANVVSPRIKSLFMRSARAAQQDVPIAELESVLSLGHAGTGAPLFVLDGAIKTMTMELNGQESTAQHLPHVRAAEASRKKLPELFSEALKRGAKVNPTNLRLVFDATNPETVRWATDHAAELVTDIDADARNAIRAVVVNSFEQGIGPYDTARLLRSTIGLTERDAVAVLNRHAKLVSQGAPHARAQAEKYADRLLRSRAETIARTESMRASNQGQLQLWKQAESKGLLTGREKKVWLVADPCPLCAPLDGETVGINESFSVGLDAPPLHPRCKCTPGLVM